MTIQSFSNSDPESYKTICMIAEKYDQCGNFDAPIKVFSHILERANKNGVLHIGSHLLIDGGKIRKRKKKIQTALDI